MKNNQQYTGLEIAIVGMACRFPGAANWRDFWKNLAAGTESVRFYTSEELVAFGMDKHEIDSPGFVKAGVVLDNKDAFDAAFFDYRPQEAELMNPAHRIFHECVWEALEDAGYVPGETKGLTGLFAGGGQDLNWKVYSMLRNASGSIDDFTLSQLNNKDYLASLLAYKLNLKGPSFSVNTACSTSLVAVNLACKSLLLGEVKTALAGGVSIVTQKRKGYLYQEGMIDAADGHCRAFDASASGCIGGEGAGVVVLKRLSTAIEDKDQIYAVIKGIAINSDGNRKVGFTAPSVEGQADCIRKAHAMARIEPETVTYIEAHGTGTKLGDPIEVEALNIAFNNNKDHRCAIGSVKTNIGHLDTAAGVAGLIKVALCLKYKQLPASLHFKAPNPAIDFAGGPFYVNATLTNWNRHGNTPLRAGLSSFGIGGTNAHAVLEEAPIQAAAGTERTFRLLTLSAKTHYSLARYADTLHDFLTGDRHINLSDMSYTLQTGRKAFRYRASLVYNSREDLLDKLKDLTAKDCQHSGPVIFMFPGQGAQYAGMGRDLYDTEPFFREVMDEGFSIIREQTGEDYRRILYPPDESAFIHDTQYTQSLIFLVEYCLGRLLMQWGIVPQYMIGHSIGEYAAACLSGVLSYKDALRLVLKRGALMSKVAPGDMLSVRLQPEAAPAYQEAGISLAAVNSAQQVVFSGDKAAIAALSEKLAEADIAFVKLQTSHAFHSAMQDGILPDFAAELDKVTFRKPERPFISNVSGDFITDEEASSPGYWLRHLRETVAFSAGIKRLLSVHEAPVFIEVGPGHSLSGLVKQHGIKQDALPVHTMRAAKMPVNDAAYLLERIGRLWERGVAVDWHSYYKEEERRRISLPAYCFEPVRYPVEVDPLEQQEWSGKTRSSGQLRDWIYYPVWKTVINGMSRAVADRKAYLLFSADNVFGSLLKRQLSARGHEVVEIWPGAGYEKLSKDRYIIHPAAENDYRALFRHLQQDGVDTTNIIYCWPLLLKAGPLLPQAENPELHLAYFGIANIVKALSGNDEQLKTHIRVITDSLHKITGNERGHYTASLALGLVHVIPQEQGVIGCSNIDIDLQEGEEKIVRYLAEELLTDREAGKLMALRNGRRWIQDFQRNAQPLETAPGAVKRGGIYLITGGLGKLGLVLARHLLTTYGARVILTGRSPHPDSRMQELDGEVNYYCADVSDAAAMKKIVEEVSAQFGPIQGVIHAAGNIDRRYFELCEDITAAKTLELFAAKVGGINALYETFRDTPLDFVWVASSLSSVLGGLGYASYAAANLYMDHFVTAFAETLPGWKCIGLSGMLFTAEEAAKEQGPHRKALKPEEITALFDWSAGLKNVPVLLQTTEDLHTRLQQAYMPPADVAPAETAQQAERPGLSTAYAAPETVTEKRLALMIGEFFGIMGIGMEDSFFELGGDSLKAMILVKKIREEFRINLGLDDFFDLQNVRQIAAEIDERLWMNDKTESGFVAII
jgi:acyl transferase domain-containing protein/NAD(P)-dependent dehydrogenase (short-subunit alcohol dehydrogenase family)/acyl carrier protein